MVVSALGYWKHALRVSPANGNFFVQIAYKNRRVKFTFERNATGWNTNCTRHATWLA